jgi:adenylate cyclase
MADVFVSYARSDKARVAPLVAAIEAQGWSVWWDPEIAPGQEFDRQIAAELKIATAVLVVWTPKSVPLPVAGPLALQSASCPSPT